MMTAQVYDKRGNRITLGRELGRSGEGVVLEVCDNRGLAAKIYHKPASADKALKLAAMAALPSERLLRLAAWPVDTLHGQPGSTLIGFLMPKAAQLEKIHDLYGVKSRMVHFPNANWHFLLRTASNLARAFRAVHDHNFVIGDVNEGNVFVTSRATVMLLDCDSFQARINNRVFVTGVGVENYTPPELQGQSFRDLVRTPDHDAFGLAVLVFLLLFMGKHPFAGGYLGVGEMPIARAITEYRFAYGEHAQPNQMRQPPASLPLRSVSPQVALLFERAFLRQIGGSARPTPSEWANALDGLIKQLRLCSKHSGHVFWNGLSDCPWCQAEAATGIQLFGYSTATAAQSHSFDLAKISAQIGAIPVPLLLPQLPTMPNRTVVPSQWLLQQKQEYNRGLGAFTAALGLNTKQNQAKQRIHVALQQATFSRNTVAQRWQSNARLGQQPFVSKRNDLEAMRQRYLSLPALHRQRMQQLDANRRQFQLLKYLDGFGLLFASISGIGHGRKATLQAYGIETAADLTEQAILDVPGFGPTYTDKLLRWRRSIELGFVFNPVQGHDPAQIARIDAEVTSLRNRLEQDLTHGVELLRQIGQRITVDRQALIRDYETSLLAVAQAEVDLRAL